MKIKNFLSPVLVLFCLVALCKPANAWEPWWHDFAVLHHQQNRHDYSSDRRSRNDSQDEAGVSPLPNPQLTPGAINPEVTPYNIDSTICKRGWTKTVRPRESYTEPLKKRQIRAFGYADQRPWHYEEDHLIPLELGGSPGDPNHPWRNPKNLWPEPHLGPNQWGSFAKDRLENKLNHLVCDGRLPLNEAREMIATNWIKAYQEEIGPYPDNNHSRRYRN